jgi:hypothetical protein
MNEIVDIYICPVCGSVILEDTDARRGNAYEGLHQPERVAFIGGGILETRRRAYAQS